MDNEMALEMQKYYGKLRKYFIVIAIVLYSIAYLARHAALDQIYAVLLLFLFGGVLLAIQIYGKATIRVEDKDPGTIIIAIGLLGAIAETLIMPADKEIAHTILLVTGPAIIAMLAALIITASAYNKEHNIKRNTTY